MEQEVLPSAPITIRLCEHGHENVE